MAVTVSTAVGLSACDDCGRWTTADYKYADAYDDGVRSTCEHVYRHSDRMSEELVRANICPPRR